MSGTACHYSPDQRIATLQAEIATLLTWVSQLAAGQARIEAALRAMTAPSHIALDTRDTEIRHQPVPSAKGP